MTSVWSLLYALQLNLAKHPQRRNRLISRFVKLDLMALKKQQQQKKKDTHTTHNLKLHDPHTAPTNIVVLK